MYLNPILSNHTDFSIHWKLFAQLNSFDPNLPIHLYITMKKYQISGRLHFDESEIDLEF
jgi:hypothetical protein